MRYLRRKYAPPTDLIEVEDRLVVIVEIAGMQVSDFDIKLTRRTLVISGERVRPNFDHPAHHQMEIGYGAFRIVTELPWDVNQKDVTATYHNGFLRVELPRLPANRVRVIEIDSEGQHHDG